MRYTLKHRLIGAAVLAAVAVLLLPSFFKEKKDYQVNTKSQIPAHPNLVAEEFKPPQPVPNIEPAPAPETMFVPTEAAPEQEKLVSNASSASVNPNSAVNHNSAVNYSSAANHSSVAVNRSSITVSHSSAPAVAMKTTATSAHAASVPAMPLNAQGIPDAWVVQVGSFTTKEAANKLRDDLQEDGQKAYVRTTTTSGGSISRVYIGPKLDRAQAQAIKEQMDKRLKVKSMVMRFQP